MGAVGARPAAEKPESSEQEAGDSERQKRKQRPQNWKYKPEVLEQVNELIAELDGIAGSISSQVSNRAWKFAQVLACLMGYLIRPISKGKGGLVVASHVFKNSHPSFLRRPKETPLSLKSCGSTSSCTVASLLFDHFLGNFNETQVKASLFNCDGKILP